jgi:hypothetical protein
MVLGVAGCAAAGCAQPGATGPRLVAGSGGATSSAVFAGNGGTWLEAPAGDEVSRNDARLALREVEARSASDEWPLAYRPGLLDLRRVVITSSTSRTLHYYGVRSRPAPAYWP